MKVYRDRVKGRLIQSAGTGLGVQVPRSPGSGSASARTGLPFTGASIEVNWQGSRIADVIQSTNFGRGHERRQLL